LSFKEYLGVQDPLIPMVATGFGAGIGRKGSVCGALTGSILAIGMKLGRRDPNDQETKEKVYEKCYQFCSEFERELGSRECCDLIGIHLDNPEERKKWVAEGGHEKCAAIVEKTAKMLCQFMEALPSR